MCLVYGFLRLSTVSSSNENSYGCHGLSVCLDSFPSESAPKWNKSVVEKKVTVKVEALQLVRLEKSIDTQTSAVGLSDVSTTTL